MKLVLFGGESNTWHFFRKLFTSSGHQLEWRKWGEQPDYQLSEYDMLLIAGYPESCEDLTNLVCLAREIKQRSPHVPIVVLSHIDVTKSNIRHASPSCGVTKSPGGVLHVHCRLRDLAWNETEAVLLDALRRQPFEPVIFEYQE